MLGWKEKRTEGRLQVPIYPLLIALRRNWMGLHKACKEDLPPLRLVRLHGPRANHLYISISRVRVERANEMKMVVFRATDCIGTQRGGPSGVLFHVNGRMVDPASKEPSPLNADWVLLSFLAHSPPFAGRLEKDGKRLEESKETGKKRPRITPESPLPSG